jgi:carboxypeptidase Q
MRLALTALLAAGLATTAVPAQTPAATVSPETRTAVRNLIGEVMVNGQAYEYDRQLADNIGPRLTGSDNYNHAVTWTQEQFRTLGLTNVHTEPFNMPALWEPEVPASGNITSPRLQALHIYSAGWSPSTPDAGISGTVLYLPAILPIDKLEAMKDKINGHIVLVDNQSFGEHQSIGDLIKALVLLSTFSPQAVLLTGSANGTQNADSLTFDGQLSPFPVAQIGREDELLIKRFLDKGPVTVQFSFKNHIRPATQVMNVVADLPGRDLPNEFVIVGGHLDSWHPGTGAQDNGTGAATVLDVARSVHALGRPPRRTMRFILFGGEEEGLVGSTAYTKQHVADMPSIDAVLISDTGAQPAKGWYLMAREDEKQALAPIEPLLAGLGSNGTSADTEFLFETDHAGFDVLGVPTLVLWNATDKYFKLHHQASDTFDSVVQPDLTQGVATTAATAYAIADAAQPFAPHYTPTQVEDMLKKANELENYKVLKSNNWVP